MTKDWKEVSDDEILNFEGSQTAFMARYERIMQKRSTDAVIGLRDKLVGLMETIYRASLAFKTRLTNSTSYTTKVQGPSRASKSSSSRYQSSSQYRLPRIRGSRGSPWPQCERPTRSNGRHSRHRRQA